MRNSQGFFGYFCFKAVGIRFPVKGKIFVILKFFFLAGKFLWTGWRHLIFWVFRFLTDFFIHFVAIIISQFFLKPNYSWRNWSAAGLPRLSHPRCLRHLLRNRYSPGANFIFCKIMESEPELCKHLLEILLHIEIDHLELHKAKIETARILKHSGVDLSLIQKATGLTSDQINEL